MWLKKASRRCVTKGEVVHVHGILTAPTPPRPTIGTARGGSAWPNTTVMTLFRPISNGCLRSPMRNPANLCSISTAAVARRPWNLPIASRPRRGAWTRRVGVDAQAGPRARPRLRALHSRRRHDLRAAAGRDRSRRVAVRGHVLRRSGPNLRQYSGRHEAGGAALCFAVAGGAGQSVGGRVPARGVGSRLLPARDLHRRTPAHSPLPTRAGCVASCSTPVSSTSTSNRRNLISLSYSAKGLNTWVVELCYRFLDQPDAGGPAVSGCSSLIWVVFATFLSATARRCGGS